MAEPADAVSPAELMAVCLVCVLTVLESVLPTFYAVGERNYPDALPLLLTVAWASGVWAWLYAYAVRRRLTLPMDAGWFLLFAWWVMVPYYLFRANGWKALIPLAAFGMLWAIAYGVAWLLWVAAAQ
jgi:hypothetical protein